ncbi:MAG: hypothetical protein AUG81_10105 [Verrucomicrobia bacterium 13_1_20CM_4_54_11]|nr:MAG: hypothetical protein AUG81_10105 [Verrucomicrobia bacterium 13_1_20CM_4_54_11]
MTKVVNQLARYKINSFPIQNQANHITANLAKTFVFNRCCPRLRKRFYNDYNSSSSTVTMKESSQDEKRRGSSNKAGWSLGWVSALDHEGRTIFVADAHRAESVSLRERMKSSLRLWSW